jgi:hypothetical protein
LIHLAFKLILRFAHFTKEAVMKQDKFKLQLQAFLAWLSLCFGETEALVTDKPRTFYPQLFTLQSFASCLRLAFVYPLLLALIWWVLSGQVHLLDQGQPLAIFPRLLVAVGVIFMCFSTWRLSLYHQNGEVGFIMQLLLFIAAGLVIGFTLNFSVAVVLGMALICAGIGSINGVFFGVFISFALGCFGILAWGLSVGVDAFYIIAIFAILITPIVLLSKRIKRIKRTGLQWLALCILWCFIATLGMGFIMLSGPLKPLIILPLFVVFLALANAVVFWFSMNVFRGNVVKIVERKSHPTMVVMDIMVTIIAVVALAVMTWLPLTLVWGEAGGLKMSGGLKVEYYWVYAMLLTPVVPTLLYLGLYSHWLALSIQMPPAD